MITSLQNPLIKTYAKLHQKKYRTRTNLFIVEGEHLVEEAQKAGVIKAIFATKPYTQFDDVTHVNDSVMKKLSDTDHIPKIIAICTQSLTSKTHDHVLILEHIQDPGNLGTLLRSALAFNFKTIVLDDTVDLFNAKAIRSTQGALFHLSFKFMTTEEFKTEHPDFTYIVTDVAAQDKIQKPQGKIALILGNEGTGVIPSTKALADLSLGIPIDNIESLNVGVAGSIIMQQLNGQPFLYE